MTRMRLSKMNVLVLELYQMFKSASPLLKTTARLGAVVYS